MHTGGGSGVAQSEGHVTSHQLFHKLLNTFLLHCFKTAHLEYTYTYHAGSGW